jgi:hypothetical protein
MSNPTLNPRTSTKASTTDSSAISSPLNTQIRKLKQLLFTKDTATNLGESLRILFALLKETLMLIWLALCWGIVAIAWLATKTTQAGQTANNWWVTLQEARQHQTASDIAIGIGKSVLNTSKALVKQILTKAKKQVGLSDE